MGPFLSLGTRTPFATFAQLCLRGFKRVVHAAFRWYSWISPPRTSRRSIVPTVDRPIAGADLGRGERAVGAFAVVMGGVGTEHSLEVAAAEDQQPVETLGADCADKALGVSVCLWCADRCVDHLDAFTAEDLVEGGAELAVAIVDQESHPLEHAGKAEVARLLGYPGAGRVGRAARQVDTAVSEFMLACDFLTVETISLRRFLRALLHARGLLAEEIAPARACASGGRLETGAEQDAPHRARRDT